MKKIICAVMIISSLSLVGCAYPGPGFAPSSAPMQAPVYIKQGMVIGIQNTTISVNDPNLAGAAIGGVAGGVVGHQMGKGNGKTALTILGALGGAMVGSQVNSEKLVQGYAVTIRGTDGEVLTFNSQNYLPLGMHVNYKNQNNHVTLY